MVALNHPEINITCGVIHVQPYYIGTAETTKPLSAESLLLYYLYVIQFVYNFPFIGPLCRV